LETCILNTRLQLKTCINTTSSIGHVYYVHVSNCLARHTAQEFSLSLSLSVELSPFQCLAALSSPWWPSTTDHLSLSPVVSLSLSLYWDYSPAAGHGCASICSGNGHFALALCLSVSTYIHVDIFFTFFPPYMQVYI
jgi:hypothetical protein